MTCEHKCHKKGCELNPWIEVCPICHCQNANFDPDAELPGWAKELKERLAGLGVESEEPK
jgi:hypothetical protein